MSTFMCLQVLILLIYMAISLLDLRGKIQDVQDQRDVLARQVTDQRLENQKLEDAIANSSDPEMLEQVARDRGYVEENEIDAVIVLFSFANFAAESNLFVLAR